MSVALDGGGADQADADRATDRGATLDALRRMILISDRRRQAIAARCGVSVTDLSAMSQLRAQGPLGPSDLSALVGINSSSTTALIDRLERLGLVVRHRHPGDRRRAVVAVTDKGNGFVDEVRDCFGRALDTLPVERLPDIAGALQVLADALVDTNDDEGAPIRI